MTAGSPVMAALAVCAFAACEPGQNADPEERDPASFAIVHVTVVDMTGSPPLSDRTVLVRDGRIVRVAPADQVEVDARTRVVDGRNRWLIPGLWDMHAHTSDPPRDLPLYLANGITGIRDMGGEAPENPPSVPGTFSVPWSALRPLRDSIRSGSIRGPRIFAAGVMLDAPQPWPGTAGVPSADSARAIVRSLRDEGVDFIKVGSGVTPECFAAIIDESRRSGLHVAGHVPRGMTALTVATAGQESIEHLMGMPSDCFSDTGPGSLCVDEITALVATGVAIVPTLVAWRGRLLGGGDDATARPEMRYVETLAARWAAEPAPSETVRERNQRMFAQFLATVAAVRAGGVPILTGTDCANAWVVPGFALHDELRLLVAAGLSNADALAAATVLPARFLGLEDEVGTIVSGKRADLVLLDADPLADVANTSRIAAVVIGGAILERAALDSLLQDVARTARVPTRHH